MPDKFTVIVIGGGPIGLTAAHALHLADIDFVLLERRPTIVEDKGASLVVYPHTFRVWHQFGILKKVLSVGVEINHHLSFTANGHVFNESPRYDQIRINHGYGPVAFHRAELVDLMYEGLPATAKEKIFTGKNLVDIQSSDSGVKVTCSDGSTFYGAMVIGADGVHSKTRRLMRDLALREDPLRNWDPENPFVSTYRLLFGSFPASSPAGAGYDIQSRDKAIMYFSGLTRGWFFLYDKLPQPTRESTKYSDDDIQDLAKEFAEFPLTRTVKVKDVWPKMLGVGMTDLQEGIVQHWSLGRIVLAGDSCHKLTTHLGLGFNNGVQDIVVLCNNLREIVRKAPGGNPDASSLTQAFEKYESIRKSAASFLVADLSHSGMETRMHTWANSFYWMVSRYLAVPRFVESIIFSFLISHEIQKAQVLNYVSKEDPMKGRLVWQHRMGDMMM